MDVNYNVTIEAAKKENQFLVTYLNEATKKNDSFQVSGQEIKKEDWGKAGQHPAQLTKVGEKLFAFLDGGSRLQTALDEAEKQGAVLNLCLSTCPETADWPFELLSFQGEALLTRRLHLVRRVSKWGEEKETEPENRSLKILFMACSALDVKPVLDFEKEEEAIFRITGKLAVDMEVEDSGSLEGLREQLTKARYDVAHLSGHADIDKKGRPFFVMEDDTGYRQDVYPEKLWKEALIENPPRLLFLSGCRTGEAFDNAAFSFARLLVEQFRAAAVLGWGRSVRDDQATLAGEVIYRELSRGQGLLEAVQRARHELVEHFRGSANPAWPLLRLFCGGEKPSAMVKKGQKKKPQPRRVLHTYLKQSRVKVLAEGFVGRRRQVQQSLRVLKKDFDKVGLLLHGAGGLGKSCLSGKISERFPDHTLIIVHGRLDSVTLGMALERAFVIAEDEAGCEILKLEAEMKEKVAKLCVSVFKRKNYLLLFDDFEQNIEGAERGEPGEILPGAADLLKVLLFYLPHSDKMSQVMFTSRYSFSLEEGGLDLVKEYLQPVSLHGFREAELRKKARELKNILYYPDGEVVDELLAAGYGNPRLLEWIDVLVGQMVQADVARLLAAVKGKREEFIRVHVLRELLGCGGEELTRFLSYFAIYRLPVQKAGVEKIASVHNETKQKFCGGPGGSFPKAPPGRRRQDASEDWQELLDRGIHLSLVEQEQARSFFQVTPLLREELLQDLEDPERLSCFEAAFAYYEETCTASGSFDPIQTEEWIFFALGCGREATASQKGGALVKYLQQRLAFRESARVGLWVLAEKKQELANEHDAFLLNELAGVIDDLGEHREAVDYYEQTLEIIKKVHGEKHPHVAVILNNLGTAWDDLGEKKKAIDYYEQALEIDRNLFGEKHPKVAIRLNNLGSAWKALGELKKAIAYFEQALEIDRNIFGDKHPDVAIDLNNLGTVYFQLGQKDRAREYLQQAYDIFFQFFGPEHPNTKIAAGWLEDC
ncbi:MAG: tetratricopeptide repeat protein [Candidatus Aminicenantes bacterium]|nr:tetratricopeptide repeat protein [Candidatus Aminicenantes bacterium]